MKTGSSFSLTGVCHPFIDFLWLSSDNASVLTLTHLLSEREPVFSIGRYYRVPDMFRKILYATDFSRGAKKALKYIVQIKDAGVEEAVILHVVDTRHFHIPEIFKIIDLSFLGERQVDTARKRTGIIGRKIRSAEIKTTVRIEKGIPYKEILRVEKEEEVSIIILGSRGFSNVKEILLGSVAEKILRKTRKPVLVIR